MIRISAPGFCKATQAADTVIFAVDGVFSYEISLFGYHEKQESIDDPQELLIKLYWLEPAFNDCLSKILVSWMTEKAIAQDLEGLLNSIPQPITYTSPLFKGHAVVAFQKTLGRIFFV
ncbi:MAG: hypothetical protein JRH08_11885 [Deltaproteobacteria bacterium]|nr:hypothetical protein [Deltaproteobacteria bacterium]MBW1931046.1 hypothetical protein [Deltaproteobacteria bacterium]MBW2026388.1 hypothetical protein [Deltaproteobacteria bacterium]MBW2126372.1 hypothetical protein [Deltaproteobacteria bacterium]